MPRDVRMKGFRDRAEVAEVLRLLAERIVPLPAETVPLPQAAERVLAGDVVAEVNVPGFDRAAMDGYALHGAETFGAGDYNPAELKVVGAALPGRPFAGRVEAGQAVRIMTGAPIPGGADAVLQAEAAEEVAGTVRITEAVPPGRHIGRVGEDIAVGTTLFKAGRRLRPQDLGVLASVGHGEVSVVRRPVVALVVTGDELLPCGARPRGCQIVDSNSIMMAALARRDGGLPLDPLLLRDEADVIRRALETLASESDVVLLSGGSSVGQEDHAPRLVAELGELPIHGVALRPAAPAGVGFIRGKPVFLMPGNPVSCLCAYDLFAGRAVRRLGGRSFELPYRTRELPLSRKLSSAVGRFDYVRVLVREDQVEPLAISGASVLSSTTRADGFVLVPPESEGHPPGDTVRVYFYD